MNKISLKHALLATGLVAAAGFAQAADTFDGPTRAGEASTMTHGVPNAVTTNSPYPDGTPVIVGAAVAAPGTTTTTTTYHYTYPVVSYPNTVTTYYPATVAVAPVAVEGATETSNVPLSAGEASTMTHGVPNVSTNNFAPGVVVGTGPVVVYHY